MGDLAWNDAYYAPYNSSWTSNPVPNVIESGNKIGDITMLNSAELAAAGFDLSSLGQKGSETFGFKFAKSLLPIGQYLATLILECNNDAIALRGETTKIIVEPPKEVPEPSSIFGIMTTALILVANKFSKRYQIKFSKHKN
ncbi:PEP-CTERM sorting domain-containing protein [Anabaena sp. UHCC 0187]|uniref:PEP-CTERM sorting domain-containing protein n=1 Tax=Anabaena sp. UHCC 0187 TaxID=2590018 RepID=UPI001445ADC1|nr:PEP-CTERM sorting domain-containing protein [Anabaena sp. UHCC 0187]MDP5018492.1 PEP-CTERM sorting domain-containing protein [Dolichospermum sp.]MTJ13563.1 PEP-CTERM sorting domain-containing protein [Anabaena sp. UHCC 0187]